jgi:peptidoglycan/LPS O-acetylase OafA/YrhL
MSFAALVAALMLALALFPGILLGVEERYTWALARVAARLSEGSLDDQTAFRRIRRGEGIHPSTSVRIFALGGFFLAILARAFNAETTETLPGLLVLLFAIATVVCAAKAEDGVAFRVGALLLGGFCVVVIF